MFPLNDSIPSKHTPHAVRLIIIVNALLFLWMVTLSESQVMDLFYDWGLVPMYIFDSLTYGISPSGGGWLTGITHMFLHGGWLHVIANLWTLWVFGDNVEDVMGSLRFIVFYLICGLAGAALHVYLNPESDLPMIGASGAIAGVLGAYFRSYPHSRVLTLVPVLFIPLIFRIPAVVYVLFWAAVQFFSGMTSVHGAPLGGVAWFAHLGGFIAGLVLVSVFARADQRGADARPWF